MRSEVGFEEKSTERTAVIVPRLPSFGITSFMVVMLWVLLPRPELSLLSSFERCKQGVIKLLHEFELASGQKVNIAKSSIFFSPNSDAQTRSQICSILGMSEASDGSLYLSLPNIIGHNKSSIFGFLKNKVLARINNWDGQFLSSAIDSLFSIEDRRWDAEIVYDLFNHQDATLILADVDFWSWSGDRSGTFSVKSAYTLLQNGKSKRAGADNSGFWHKLWHLKIPPKVKNFLCWLEEVFHKFDENQVGHAAMLCWALWKARNATFWNKKLSSHTEILASASTTLDHWRKAQGNTCLFSLFFERKGDGAELWTKPDSNNINVNVDAALFAQENSYGFEIVARDSHGKLIEAKSCYQGGEYPAKTIEAIGIKEALSWVKNKQWQNVQIETDSMLTIQSIRSNQKMNSTFRLVIQDCQLLLSSLQNVNFYFIRRSTNRVAHAVTRHSRSFPSHSIFEHNVWADLKALVYSEC
uniref:RNase H type-1 domain-containing protein n=1 Tax=Cannabis sativa TaxID=3483 RepID=A0A803PDA2_CANSA